jgi:hypothetical protein
LKRRKGEEEEGEGKEGEEEEGNEKGNENDHLTTASA